MNKLIYFIAIFVTASQPLSAQLLGPSTTFYSNVSRYIPAYSSDMGRIYAQLSYSREYFSGISRYKEYSGILSYGIQNSHFGTTISGSQLGSTSLQNIGLFYSYKINFDGYRSRQGISFAIAPSLWKTERIVDFILRDRVDRILVGNDQSLYLFDLGISALYSLDFENVKRNFSVFKQNTKNRLQIGLSLASMTSPQLPVKDNIGAGITLLGHLYNFITYYHPMNRAYGLEGGIYTSLTQGFDFTSSGIVTAHHYNTNTKVGLGYSSAQQLIATTSLILDSTYSDDAFEIGALVTYNMRKVINTHSPVSLGIRLKYRKK